MSRRHAGMAAALAAFLPLAFLLPIDVSPASAGTVSCKCYCGISLPAPCGDEDCKRACGWKEPSGGGSAPYGGAGAIGDAVSEGIRAGMQRAREQERIRAEQEERALQQNRDMMRSLDLMVRERQEEEDEAKRGAAERERLLDDRRRSEALSGLTGLPAMDNLALKPASDFFGVPANQGGDAFLSDPSVVDLRHLSPDRPITVDPAALKGDSLSDGKPVAGKGTDCVQTRAVRARLDAGLPVQLEAIRRTEAQLDAAAKSVVKARAEGRQLLVKGALDEVKGYAKDTLSTVRALRGQIEALGALDKGKRDVLIRSLNALAFAGEDLAQAASAGAEGGEALRKKQDSIARRVAELADKGFVESGIAEKMGEALAGKLWGPLGELSFRGAKLSIDLGVAVGGGVVSEEERRTARSNLDTMRTQYERALRRVSELDAELARSCGK
ncbi:MAG TPA: hypothetical protein VIU40_08945 [Geobacteraceae bacterium]